MNNRLTSICMTFIMKCGGLQLFVYSYSDILPDCNCPHGPAGDCMGVRKKTAARLRHEVAYSVGEGGVTGWF